MLVIMRILIFGICVVFLSFVFIFDAIIGMTKAQIVALIGPPDWEEPNNLWAYRVRGDGIAGISFPYYFTFDAKGILTSVHS